VKYLVLDFDGCYTQRRSIQGAFISQNHSAAFCWTQELSLAQVEWLPTDALPPEPLKGAKGAASINMGAAQRTAEAG
jgi:hypothetical protein